jgi:hypothetical protein
MGGLRNKAGKPTAVQLLGAVWGTKPENHGGTAFMGGLGNKAGKSTADDFQGGPEGQSPSGCAAGATPTTYPANFRCIQRRKERP